MPEQKKKPAKSRCFWNVPAKKASRIQSTASTKSMILNYTARLDSSIKCRPGWRAILKYPLRILVIQLDSHWTSVSSRAILHLGTIFKWSCNQYFTTCSERSSPFMDASLTEKIKFWLYRSDHLFFFSFSKTQNHRNDLTGITPEYTDDSYPNYQETSNSNDHGRQQRIFNRL